MKKTLVFIAALAAVATVGAAGAAPPTLTLKSSTASVVYGGSATLTGALSTQRSGQTLTMQAQECGKPNFAGIADVKTGAGGAFSFVAKPTINTVYRVKLKGATSPSVAVTVKPVLRLKKVATGKYKATLTAGQSFAGKYVNFQRFVSSTRKWRTVTRITFTTGQASGPAPTTVSSATKTIRTKTRLRVRLMLPQAQAGCYLATTSNSVRS